MLIEQFINTFANFASVKVFLVLNDATEPAKPKHVVVGWFIFA